jgi:16S rRNA (guanine1516-N2)-methyltransferase
VSDTPSIPVIPASTAQAAAAASLGDRWGLPLAAEAVTGYWLRLGPERLELVAGDGSHGPVFVDFAGGAMAHRQRFGGGLGQPIAKAAGLGRGLRPRILDATAGLGRDAFVFASLGCEVLLVERVAWVAALLEDGLRRARAVPALAEVAGRMQLLAGDAQAELAACSPPPEVVYIDPMYPHVEQRALARKEMQAFRRAVGADEDADRLLLPALACAQRRVVVKRPADAPHLAGRPPTLTFPTRKHRFDVYVIASAEKKL